MYDIFIAYKGTDDKSGTQQEAETIYDFLSSKGISCYLFTKDASPDYGATKEKAKMSERFLLVANESIRYDLSENGSLQEGSHIYSELVSGFLSNYATPDEAKGKVRVVCCGSFSTKAANNIYAPVTKNIVHIPYDGHAHHAILNWVNGYPDSFVQLDDSIDTKKGLLDKLCADNPGMKETIAAIGDGPFLAVLSLPNQSSSTFDKLSLSHIKRTILDTRYSACEGNDYVDYMEEISDELLQNAGFGGSPIFDRVAFPRYFEYLFLLKCPIIETYCVKAYYGYIKKSKQNASLVRQVERKEPVIFGENRQVITGLLGYIDRKDSLVRDMDEYRDLLSQKDNVSSYLQNAFNGPVIFVDFKKDSEFFRDIHRYIGYKERTYPNKVYLVNSEANTERAAASYDDKKNCECLSFPAEVLFQALLLSRETKRVQMEEKTKRTALPNNPYLYLNSFREEDQELFFGRDAIIDEILINIMRSSQVTVLSAESGFGKTSIINAGIIPKIKESEQYDVFVVRSYGTPWKTISKKVFKRNKEITEEEIQHVSIGDIGEKKKQLIVIDQLEELFVLGADCVSTFNKMIPIMLDKFPSIKVLISIRKDFLSQLMTLDFIRERPTGIIVQLSALQKDDAIIAIEGPVKKVGWKYEEGLVKKIVDDLTLVSDNHIRHFVDPTQLQIVCDKLFTTQRKINRGTKTISRNVYSMLGGASGILDTYIEGSIENFEQDADFELVKNILKCLVSSRNTKIQVEENKIIDQLINNNASLPKESIISMLRRLVNSRLLRRRSQGSKNCYELTHEYIIRKINQWFDERVFRIKECQELLSSEYNKWVRQRVGMDEPTLLEILSYRDSLLFSNEHSAFVLANIVQVSWNLKESKWINDLVFFIEKNSDNVCIFETLSWLINNSTSNTAVMLAYIVLTTLNGKERVKHLLPLLRYKVNPYLEDILSVLEEHKIVVSHDVKEELMLMLYERRVRDMVTVVPTNPVTLGLETERINKMIAERNISEESRQYFPNSTRYAKLPNYKIDKYLVTNSNYKEYNPQHSYRMQEGDYPVVNLTFEEASKYAKWWGKRIPDEDEWEYAARGDNGFDYPWGNEWYPKEEAMLCSQNAISEDQKRCNTSLSGTDGLRSVQSYPQGISPFGCYNMAGTVWEWTSTTSEFRSDSAIVKGGSWSVAKIYPWTWYRYSRQKIDHQPNIGFRCVITEEQNG